MYVSCPPQPSGGFQQGYDATKLGKIIQTAKFFFGKVLDEHDVYLKKTCQSSISLCPERGVHDTILTLKNRRKNRRVFLPAILRRFFVVFVDVVYVIDIQCNTQIYVLPLCLYAVKNRADCLQNSLFWLVIKSILRSHFDYFAASL